MQLFDATSEKVASWEPACIYALTEDEFSKRRKEVYKNAVELE
jgi:hypothetical protein